MGGGAVDKPHIARATALLAANAYALVQTMSGIAADASLHDAAVLTVFIPAFGAMCAYSMLEGPRRRWEEWGAAIPVAVMLFLWMVTQWTS